MEKRRFQALVWKPFHGEDMAYRTDNIPLLIKPLYFAISYILAIIVFVFFIFPLRLTLRIDFQGKENLNKKPFIGCIWHQDLGPVFTSLKKFGVNQIWMNYPVWYMKPIHFLLNFIGIKELVLGSSGHNGKEAASKLCRLLKEKNASTIVAVDGPLGPSKVLKKGVLYMALETGFPIIPLTFELSPCFILRPSWDGKKMTVPFGRMKIICHEPLYVTEDNFKERSIQLENALNRVP